MSLHEQRFPLSQLLYCWTKSGIYRFIAKRVSGNRVGGGTCYQITDFRFRTRVHENRVYDRFFGSDEPRSDWVVCLTCRLLILRVACPI